MIIQNKIKEAEEDLKQQFPVSPRSHLALGEFYNRCQRNQSAIRVFRKALEQWPDYPLFYRDMALSLAAVNLKSEAVSHMKTAIDIGLPAGLEKYAIFLHEKWESELRGVQSR